MIRTTHLKYKEQTTQMPIEEKAAHARALMVSTLIMRRLASIRLMTIDPDTPPNTSYMWHTPLDEFEVSDHEVDRLKMLLDDLETLRLMTKNEVLSHMRMVNCRAFHRAHDDAIFMDRMSLFVDPRLEMEERNRMTAMDIYLIACGRGCQHHVQQSTDATEIYPQLQTIQELFPSPGRVITPSLPPDVSAKKKKHAVQQESVPAKEKTSKSSPASKVKIPTKTKLSMEARRPAPPRSMSPAEAGPSRRPSQDSSEAANLSSKLVPTKDPIVAAHPRKVDTSIKKKTTEAKPSPKLMSTPAAGSSRGSTREQAAATMPQPRRVDLPTKKKTTEDAPTAAVLPRRQPAAPVVPAVPALTEVVDLDQSIVYLGINPAPPRRVSTPRAEEEPDMPLLEDLELSFDYRPPRGRSPSLLQTPPPFPRTPTPPPPPSPLPVRRPPPPTIDRRRGPFYSRGAFERGYPGTRRRSRSRSPVRNHPYGRYHRR